MLRRRPAAVAGVLTVLGITALTGLAANLGLFSLTQSPPPVGRLSPLSTDAAPRVPFAIGPPAEPAATTTTTAPPRRVTDDD